MRAPAPALVVAVTVAPGDEVEAGSPVAVLEAMKMEMTVVAIHAGRVREVLVAGSTHVDHGAPLVSVEPLIIEGGAAPDAPRIGFGAAAAATDPGARLRARTHLDALRSLIMGFDVSVEEARRFVGEFSGHGTSCLPMIPSCFAASSRSSRFSPTWLSFRVTGRRQSGRTSTRRKANASAPLASISGRTYTRSMSRARACRRRSSQTQSALAHYGVHELERRPEVEEAVYEDLPRPPAKIND